MTSNPFNASLLTPSLVADPAAGSGLGVLVADCVFAVEDDDSLAGVALDVPQAVNMMDAINSRKRIFFMGDFTVTLRACPTDIYCARVINGTGMKTKIKITIIRNASPRRVGSRAVI